MASIWQLKNTNRVDIAITSGSNNWSDAALELFSSGEKNVLWEDRDFFELDFTGISKVYHFFERCSFIKINLSANVWEDSDFKDTKFIKCNFTNATFNTCKAHRSYFDNCNFLQLADFQFKFEDSKFKNIDFSFAILQTNITDKSFINCTFENCKFDAIYFQNIDFENAKFNNCSFLSDAQNSINCIFDTCNLDYVEFKDCFFDKITPNPQFINSPVTKTTFKGLTSQNVPRF